MVTTKPRVFITLPRQHFGQLKRLATKRDESLSSTATQLIEAGLEMLEDEWLSEIGDQRLTSFNLKKSVSFEQVKRRFGRKSQKREG